MKPKFTGISYVEQSENAKIGPIAATYVAQQSCPTSCPFYHTACYAEVANTGAQTHRLNGDAAGISPETLAEHEAAAIRALSGDRPCRLHVVGDCRTGTAAGIVSAAARDYTAKHGQVVYTYTHSWREVARRFWRKVSVLASCETFADIHNALARGYAASIVLPAFKQATAWFESGVRVIPCPQQTGRAKNCASCKLCMRDDYLRDSRSVIAFRPDGTTGKRVIAALNRVALTQIAPLSDLKKAA